MKIGEIQNVAPEINLASARLRSGAKSFESLLLNDVLSKLHDSLVDAEPQDDAAGQTLNGLGIEALSSAWASRGGIGLGRLLERAMAKNS